MPLLYSCRTCRAASRASPSELYSVSGSPCLFVQDRLFVIKTAFSPLYSALPEHASHTARLSKRIISPLMLLCAVRVFRTPSCMTQIGATKHTPLPIAWMLWASRGYNCFRASSGWGSAAFLYSPGSAHAAYSARSSLCSHSAYSLRCLLALSFPFHLSFFVNQQLRQSLAWG